MSIARAVEPEWLDELPADDHRAVRSRRDLRRINALMMNAHLISRELDRRLPFSTHVRVAEIGAGDGTLMLKLARKSNRLRGGRVTLLDRQQLLNVETHAALARQDVDAEQVVADVFDWLASTAAVFDVIIANLFLHHFATDRLAALLALIESRAGIFVACEPHRSRLALAASGMLGVIGCNDVTRHDAIVSVRAGFSGDELSALWPQGGGWTLDERARGLFSHVFVAARDGGARSNA